MRSPDYRRKARPHRRGCHVILALLAGLWLGPATAQGGPPMVSDDPATPGDGHWEINLGDIGSRTSGGWLMATPDADINYGWGERVQLRFETPWNLGQHDGSWGSGLGTTLLGVKWRFIDDAAHDWTVSTYPQMGINLDAASAVRGLANPGRSVFLPVEGETHIGAYDLDIEAGRQLVTQGDGQWVLGVILGRALSSTLDVMLETRLRQSPGATALLLNLGSRWALRPNLTLLGAVGRDVGAANPARQSVLYYVGVQVLR